MKLFYIYIYIMVNEYKEYIIRYNGVIPTKILSVSSG